MAAIIKLLSKHLEALMSLGFHYLRRECQWTSTELYLGVNHNKDMELLVQVLMLPTRNSIITLYGTRHNETLLS